MTHYTRFGRTYSRRLPSKFTDQKTEAQQRQRALFKARQRASALFGIILQRGLTKEAHHEGLTEANYFSRLNKGCFVFDNSEVHINYPHLLVARGPLPVVNIKNLRSEGLHVEIVFNSNPEEGKARPDDVVHIYAVEPKVEICQLMTSVSRQESQASFDLPDLSNEVGSNAPITFHLYAIVESASTAGTPTLSAAEKQQNKKHRNINRRVSRSIFVGTIAVK